MDVFSESFSLIVAHDLRFVKGMDIGSSEKLFAYGLRG
jgi:hypothetical protein